MQRIRENCLLEADVTRDIDAVVGDVVAQITFMVTAVTYEDTLKRPVNQFVRRIGA